MCIDIGPTLSVVSPPIDLGTTSSSVGPVLEMTPFSTLVTRGFLLILHHVRI